MIFVHDKGRLCNNILQYAHLYAWGREHNRKTMSMRFAYKYPYFKICKTPYHNFFCYVVAKYAAKLKLIPVVHFDDENASTAEQEQIMLNKRYVVATGWYARWYDLFLKYKSEILELFTFLPEVEEKVKAILSPHIPELRSPTRSLSSLLSPLKLGLHIRRGDYKTWQNGQFYFTDEEYVRVIKSFINNLPSIHPRTSHLVPRTSHLVHIFICGNDTTLNKEYYRKELASLPVSLTFPDGNPGEDLCLLSHCDYLIGPPSTFTLVASMYHDIPLCWLSDTSRPITAASFRHFDYLFRNIV